MLTLHFGGPAASSVILPGGFVDNWGGGGMVYGAETVIVSQEI